MQNVYAKAVVRPKGEGAKKFVGEITLHWKEQTEAGELVDGQGIAFLCEAPSEASAVSMVNTFLNKDRPVVSPKNRPVAG